MGSDPSYHMGEPTGMGFQSTLPGWGATRQLLDVFIGAGFQSTLPGWGATIGFAEAASADDISIHAPRMGSDQHLVGYLRFLLYISIHAPRMGSDHICWAHLWPTGDFNPRSPDGERHVENTVFGGS